MEYLSQECYNKLVAELNELINVELPKVKNEIAEARDKGDLSENFEYHAAKRAQGKLLGRSRFKQRAGKRTGEVVEVHGPAGVLKLKIESITMGIE